MTDARQRERRRLRPIGSELPILGPLWLLTDRVLAATRLSPPRLYRLLCGQQPNPTQPVHRAAADERDRTLDD